MALALACPILFGDDSRRLMKQGCEHNVHRTLLPQMCARGVKASSPQVIWKQWCSAKVVLHHCGQNQGQHRRQGDGTEPINTGEAMTGGHDRQGLAPTACPYSLHHAVSLELTVLDLDTQWARCRRLFRQKRHRPGDGCKLLPQLSGKDGHVTRLPACAADIVAASGISHQWRYTDKLGPNGHSRGRQCRFPQLVYHGEAACGIRSLPEMVSSGPGPTTM